MNNNYTFRNRIFVALLLVNLLFLSIMAYLNFYQNSLAFRNAKLHDIERINSKIQETYNYIVENDNRNVDYIDIQEILGSRIFELANVYNTGINIYALNGDLISSSRTNSGRLGSDVINKLIRKKNIIKDSLVDDNNNILYNSYSYISYKNEPIAILNTQNNTDADAVLLQNAPMVKHYIFVVLFLMILSGFVAWFISKNLTQKIENISNKLESTDVTILDQPIQYNQKDEIQPLVQAYNNMLSRLKNQTYLLQKNEREEAWKEMAKQVAHEINNPLTPLRLTVQNFQRKYKEDDPDNPKKVKMLTESVVHQIDIISSITKSFSDFAKMPANMDTMIDIVETIRRSVDIFPASVVEFTTNTPYLEYKMDSLYLTRIVTNIIKNGIQAIPNGHNKKIKVDLLDSSNHFTISISDNGDGIPEDLKDKIFEANFTTKATGSGLGLSMVKKIVEDYKGKIWFDTEINKGTTFFVKFPKN